MTTAEHWLIVVFGVLLVSVGFVGSQISSEVWLLTLPCSFIGGYLAGRYWP